MTENSPHNSRRRKTTAHRAPGWIAPALAGAVAVAVTWGIGSTLFHGALVDHGLPEQVKDASDDERTMWVQGATLADLAARANKLAELAQGQESEALAILGTSLSQGAALLGELQFEEESPAPVAQNYSPEQVEALVQDVANFSASMPAFEDPSMERNELLAQIAFQTNFDARDALEALDEKDAHKLAKPLSSSADEGNSDQVDCLPSPDLLDPAGKAGEPDDFEPVAVARALDRGYALDFVLQLHAARGTSSQVDGIEEQRTALGKQLNSLRSVVDQKCGDLRQPAYALPENGLEDLDKVVANAQEDFDRALVTAAGNADGGAGKRIATLAYEVLSGPSAATSDQRILESGTGVN
ncbi:hypothetical protein [Glutamicibacter halophytocola]|uniref:Uncharacterized protein n=1 Tax=Glutamicibacter halophytocola TaxID=1933880 RepID=A0AA95BUU9_9MICC|nr:hypothetical protein [Glutamicibacter halophytocola]UUX59938.1 hypothetical protein NUH22_04780 [Glutamicibacter halophytocola]